MKKKVFIDGSEGTTGLKIFERFCGRDDIEILKTDSEKRKDTEERHVLRSWFYVLQTRSTKKKWREVTSDF